MFEQILVPFDGSQLAEQAVPLACTFARSAPIRVHLLRSTAGMWLPALPADPDFVSHYGPFDWLPDPQTMQQIRADAAASLDALVRKYGTSGVRWETVIVDGDPAGSIIDYAQNESVDIIIISSHGHSGLERWALGSVTERVLQRAPCPVLVARRTSASRRILVPLDGSQLAEQALAPALALAHRWNAAVTLFRVERAQLDDQSLTRRLDRIERLLADGPPDELRERSEEYLDTVRERHAGAGVRLRTVVLQGHPAQAIINYAADNEVGLIAMATHGRTGLRRWLYGSVAEKVLRAAPCSLFIVRPALK